jgi:hypothetical protein
VILGLHGNLRSGKSTAAERLTRFVDAPIEYRSFAEPMKLVAARVLGVSQEQLEAWKNEDVTVEVWEGSMRAHGTTRTPNARTFRRYLQDYSDVLRDVFGYDILVDRALPLDGDYSDKLYVLADVRRENEKARIEALGGMVVRVIGPEDGVSDHATERVLPCRVVIDNTERHDEFRLLDAQLAALALVLQDAMKS